MGYLCAPQFMGLVRGEPKKGQKHRANGGKILKEAGPERYSKSETLDKSRSYMNRYTGYESGQEAWDDLEFMADSYRVKVKGKNGKEYERKLRDDAVIGYSIIINPPAEMTVDWKDTDYRKFYDDSMEVLAEINPDLFRHENILYEAEHFDEGIPDDEGFYSRHVHIAGKPVGRDGSYCGNNIDCYLMSSVCKAYPRMMRDKGWDLNDLDVTDWDRLKTDDEYRLEREAKWKKSGRSVNEYLQDECENAAKAQEEALAVIDDATAALQKLEIMESVLKSRYVKKKNKETGEIERVSYYDLVIPEVNEKLRSDMISDERAQNGAEREESVENIEKPVKIDSAERNKDLLIFGVAADQDQDDFELP